MSDQLIRLNTKSLTECNSTPGWWTTSGKMKGWIGLDARGIIRLPMNGEAYLSEPNSDCDSKYYDQDNKWEFVEVSIDNTTQSFDSFKYSIHGRNIVPRSYDHPEYKPCCIKKIPFRHEGWMIFHNGFPVEFKVYKQICYLPTTNIDRFDIRRVVVYNKEGLSYGVQWYLTAATDSGSCFELGVSPADKEFKRDKVVLDIRPYILNDVFTRAR